MIMKHKRAMAEMQVMWEKAIRDHQHEYDSDEEVDQQAGTWEHRLRHMEMEKTRGKVHHRYGNVVLLLQHQQPRAFLIRSFKVISVCCLVCTFPEWAESLTDMGKGKHFIGDFLPPEELDKFMETFKALKVRFPLNSPVLHSNRRHLKFPCISFRGRLG